MRFLKFKADGNITLTGDLADDKLPAYAILSHTWGDDEEEVKFDEITTGTAVKQKNGYQKIKFCMDQAIRDTLQFSWVDTCCIKQSDANELGRAINSMFRWYKNARTCYVYLADVSTDEEDPHLRMSEGLREAVRASRWFTRGWTLQELIAPRSVKFFSSNGKFLGDKKTLEHLLWEITRIPARALRGCDLSEFTMAERMSWVGGRTTKLEEDRVYSLLGIFDIRLPLIYGEGLRHARERLQFEFRMRNIRQAHFVEDDLDPDTSNLSPSTRHPVGRNYDRVHVTIVYWKVDEIESLVERLSSVLEELYLYEVATICLTPEYSAIDLPNHFPWQEEDAINNRDLQILYYIGTSHHNPEEAGRGFMDIQAVSHSFPHQRVDQRNWLAGALGIPNLFSDVLVILDCYWPGLSDEGNLSISYLRGGRDWARYGVLFAGYQDEIFPVGRFSEHLINALQNLAHSVEDHDSLVNVRDVINAVRRSQEQSGDDAQPDWRGETGADSFTLAPIWA